MGDESHILTNEELAMHMATGAAADIIAAARELASRGTLIALPLMTRLFQETDRPAVRNALALAITDLQDPDAVELIAAVMRRLPTNRGTLLYALRDYDCAPILGLLVEIVIEGNFEEAREALILTDGIDVHLDAELSDRYQTALRDAQQIVSDERRPFLADLLDSFV